MFLKEKEAENGRGPPYNIGKALDKLAERKMKGLEVREEDTKKSDIKSSLPKILGVSKTTGRKMRKERLRKKREEKRERDKRLMYSVKRFIDSERNGNLFKEVVSNDDPNKKIIILKEGVSPDEVEKKLFEQIKKDLNPGKYFRLGKNLYNAIKKEVNGYNSALIRVDKWEKILHGWELEKKSVDKRVEEFRTHDLGMIKENDRYIKYYIPLLEILQLKTKV